MMQINPDRIKSEALMPIKSLQGTLLLDGGKLQGSFFHRTVVLICRHDTDGAFGLILNRSLNAKAGDAVVANLPEWIKDQPLFIGGPVQPQAFSYLHSDSFIPDGSVMLNLNIGHSLDELMEISEPPSATRQIKLFAGYAGWTAGQLEREMARHDWLTHPASMELIFSEHPEELWKNIVRQKGFNGLLAAASPDDPSWN
jgi:putative transcriptional regulator